MTAHLPGQPFMVLVDDDTHSARLMIRMLLAHGAPSVSWMQSEEQAKAELTATLADQRAQLPGLVVVDLKSSSDTTRAFIAALRALPGGEHLLVAAMAPNLARPMRDLLEGAGADAVFERHADIESYRREAAAIVRFWVRHQRLDAVGT